MPELWEKCSTNRCDELAIELPQVYLASRSRGDPNDLIQLALVVGAFEMWFEGRVFKYKPHEWKGSVPKPIMAERILKRLGDDEKEQRSRKLEEPYQLNTIDACGIGLHHLKRL